MRQQCGVQFVSPTASNPGEDDLNLMFWEGGHTIWFIPSGDLLILAVFLFGTMVLPIVVSDNPKIWKKHPFTQHTTGFLLIPQIERCLGPMPIGRLLAHKMSGRISHRIPKDEELCYLESLRRSREDIMCGPPK